jgi:hypothetical protein
MSDPWIIMPVLAQPAYTETAISDCLGQTLAAKVLIINQGVESSFRQRLERICEDHPRLYLWSHQPCLPSLAATWNRALDFVWQCGGGDALVVNNDVRLSPNTYELLRAELEEQDALMVTAVGVTKAQFQPGQLALRPEGSGHGGPDFSCYLISRIANETYPFDEAFIPAYCEDLDLHRRVMLAGEGHRIYSINVPFLHYAAGTLKNLDTEAKARIERAIARYSRTHYERKWGGPVNQERFRVPFGGGWSEPEAADNVTTPQLQAEVQRGQEHRRAEGTDGRAPAGAE